MLRIQNLQSQQAARPASAPRSTLVCRAVNLSKVGEQLSRTVQVGLLATAGSLLAVQCAYAEVRMPPISNDPDRCLRGFVGNTIGQANAVSDKVLDLRNCQFKNADLQAKVLSGALLVGADLSGSNMREAVMSKAYAVDANFTGADLSNAVIDRVDFSGANLTGVKLVNAVVTGALFDNTILTESIWEDALVGNEDVKRLCKNKTLVGESRQQVGCRN